MSSNGQIGHIHISPQNLQPLPRYYRGMESLGGCFWLCRHGSVGFALCLVALKLRRDLFFCQDTRHGIILEYTNPFTFESRKIKMTVVRTRCAQTPNCVYTKRSTSSTEPPMLHLVLCCRKFLAVPPIVS